MQSSADQAPSSITPSSEHSLITLLNSLARLVRSQLRFLSGFTRRCADSSGSSALVCPFTHVPSTGAAASIRRSALDPRRSAGRFASLRSQLYTALCKRVMDERDGLSKTESAGGALITGNSRVGKRVFLTYLMKELQSLHRPPSIVYHEIAAQSR